MTLQPDDWDDDERLALEDIQKELDELRARHRNDPPFDLLRAARADALPESLQARLTEHLNRSAWSRALVEGDAETEPSFDAEAERRLLSRITRSTRGSRWHLRSWVPALAAAAVLVVIVGVLRTGPPPASDDQQPTAPVETPVASAPPARTFTLPLDKPDVKLTPKALVLRSGTQQSRFVDDLAPALKAFSGNSYDEAEKRFAALQTQYPTSVEVAFYRAITQLFLSDAAAAVASLQAARRVDDGAFAAEIAWYLAVAHDRAGDLRLARVELEALCRQTSAYTSRACAAAATLEGK